MTLVLPLAEMRHLIDGSLVNQLHVPCDLLGVTSMCRFYPSTQRSS